MSNEPTTLPFHILLTLRADGPHPDYSDKLMLFGQFVGVWDLDIKYFDESEKIVYHEPGEWSFSWILDGRAIQDVLTAPNPQDTSKIGPGERGIGTTLRKYDPKLDVWRIVWLGAVSGVLVVFTAKPMGNEIWVEGLDDDGLNRWVFTDISDYSFHWKGFLSNDGGNSWTLRQDMLAHRRSANC